MSRYTYYRPIDTWAPAHYVSCSETRGTTVRHGRARAAMLDWHTRCSARHIVITADPTPLVSIIVPCYAASRDQLALLDETLGTVDRQDYARYE